MDPDTGIAILIMVATLAAFATFAVIAWLGIRQREVECRLDPSKC
jgi:hypothetical protein